MMLTFFLNVFCSDLHETPPEQPHRIFIKLLTGGAIGLDVTGNETAQEIVNKLKTQGHDGKFLVQAGRAIPKNTVLKDFTIDDVSEPWYNAISGATLLKKKASDESDNDS